MIYSTVSINNIYIYIYIYIDLLRERDNLHVAYNAIPIHLKYNCFLLYRYLMVNPRDYRVVVVESILAPSNFRNLLAKALFAHFGVSVCILLSNDILSLSLSLSVCLSLSHSHTHTHKVPNVCFLPHHLACLFTVGRSTALVVDIGFNESSVIPVSTIIVIVIIIIYLSCKIILYNTVQY